MYSLFPSATKNSPVEISKKETPIDFQDHGKETYKIALLNVTKSHGVPIQEDEDRVILKIRFVNRSYEEVREKLIEHL